jgi:hypothetical protein
MNYFNKKIVDLWLFRHQRSFNTGKQSIIIKISRMHIALINSQIISTVLIEFLHLNKFLMSHHPI